MFKINFFSYIPHGAAAYSDKKYKRYLPYRSDAITSNALFQTGIIPLSCIVRSGGKI